MSTIYLDKTGCFNSPDTSGSVFPAPMSTYLTNKIFPNLQRFCFADTATKIGLLGGFKIPNDFVSTAVLGLRWLTTATSGNGVWVLDYNSPAAGESIDPAAFVRSPTTTTACPGTTLLLASTEIAMTDADLAVLDSLIGAISRNGAGADTIAATIMLWEVYFKYNNA
jgi:hypothetical protein